MFKTDDRVRCTETHMEGTVLDREWEGGWQYTLITDEGQYFYRNDRELESVY